MRTIHAIYEHGVFRPIEPVELPEGTPVLVDAGNSPADSVQAARERVYESLSRSYDGGDADESERHNERQPSI
jgi:predicted DNA-binding antitoxin AbrB/MazE fold protein